MPSPLRWPMVNRWTPSCEPSARPLSSTNRAAASVGRPPRDERRVVAVGHEADLLAVGLVGDQQSEPARLGAHVRLRQRAHRKHRAGQLLLRQREQEVRLVLVAIDAALEQPSSGRRSLDARVVAGRHLVGAESPRAIEQRRELEVAVAVRARQRRPARGVLAGRSSRSPSPGTAARSSGCSAGSRASRRRGARRGDRRACSRSRTVSRRRAGHRAASTDR